MFDGTSQIDIQVYTNTWQAISKFAMSTSFCLSHVNCSSASGMLVIAAVDSDQLSTPTSSSNDWCGYFLENGKTYELSGRFVGVPSLKPRGRKPKNASEHVPVLQRLEEIRRDLLENELQGLCTFQTPDGME